MPSEEQRKWWGRGFCTSHNRAAEAAEERAREEARVAEWNKPDWRKAPLGDGAARVLPVRYD